MVTACDYKNHCYCLALLVNSQIVKLLEWLKTKEQKSVRPKHDFSLK